MREIGEFREFGHKLIDWVADYLESPERFPVLSTVRPNDIIDGLPAHGPEQGETLDRILSRIIQFAFGALAVVLQFGHGTQVAVPIFAGLGLRRGQCRGRFGRGSRP